MGLKINLSIEAEDSDLGTVQISSLLREISDEVENGAEGGKIWIDGSGFAQWSCDWTDLIPNAENTVA